MIEIDDDDRDRGILTPADRRFLRREKDVTDSAAGNIRQRIRDRTKQALADFDLLTHLLSPGDRKQLFKVNNHRKLDKVFAEGVVAKDGNRGKTLLENVIIFVYMVCRDWGLDFWDLVERAVRRAETSPWFDNKFERREGVHDVRVTGEYLQDPDVDLDSALNQVEAGEYPGLAEVGALVLEEEIGEAELQRLRQEIIDFDPSWSTEETPAWKDDET